MSKKRMSNRDAVIKAVTGRRNKTNTWGHQLRDVVKAYGHDAAREQLGVSKSTWRAWTKGRRNPNKANLAKIAGTWDTPDVRRATLPARRARKAATNGFKVTLTGTLGPSSDPTYARPRQVAANLPPDAANRIMRAYVDNGPDAAEQAIREAIGEHYFSYNAQHEDATMADLTDINFSSRDPSVGNVFDRFDE